MSLNSPIEPDAARPESVEPVTLSDRVNAVINPTADPSPDAAAATAAKSAEKTGMPQSRKQNSATFTQPETIGLFGSRKDSFSQRYHLTRRGKLKRLAQIAQIVNQFDIVHGLTPIKMRLMFEALGPTFVKVGQILSMRSEILPQSFCDELSKLRADADPMPYGTLKCDTYRTGESDPLSFISLHIASSNQNVRLNRLSKRFNRTFYFRIRDCSVPSQSRVFIYVIY